MQLLRKKTQINKLAGYRSLDLGNKIYQIKTLRLAKGLSLRHPKILELGCADGSFAELLGKELRGKVWGVEIAKDNILLAKAKGVNAVVVDLGNKFPYDNNQFDLVVSLEVIEHVFDTDNFLRETRRVLKKGGYLILSTPNLASLQNRIRLLLGLYPRYLSYNANDGHIFLYTLPVLGEHLKKYGFEIINATSPNFLNPFITKSWLPDFLKVFSMWLGDKLPSLGSHLLVVARKI